MRTFKKYLMINIALVFLHAMMYFVAVMGFGSGTGNEPKSEIFKALLFFAAVGASPNLFVFLFSAIRRKNIIENAIWSLVFSLIIIASYFAMFWSVLVD